MKHDRKEQIQELDFNSALDAAVAALAAVDVSKSIEAGEAYQAELDQIVTALNKGHARASELRQAIQDAEKGPDGNAAASALLLGEDPLNGTAAVYRQDLETVLAGVRVLSNRRSEIEHKRRFSGDLIEPEITEALRPLVAALEAESEMAVKQLAQIYSNLNAISRLSRRSVAGRVGDEVGEIVMAARLGGRRSVSSYPPSEQLRQLTEAPCMVHLRRGCSTDPVSPSRR